MSKYRVTDTINGQLYVDVYYTDDINLAVNFIINHRDDPDYEYLVIEILGDYECKNFLTR